MGTENYCKNKLVESLEAHTTWFETGVGQPANLERLCIKDYDFYDKKLDKISFVQSDLAFSNFARASLNKANFSHTNLSHVNFTSANLCGVNFTQAVLYKTDFTDALVMNANFTGAHLNDAILNNANLSGSKGLLNAADYLKDNFEFTRDGMICYKFFNYAYPPNPKWEIVENSVIEEVVDFNRCKDCGYGVNVGTLQWVKSSILQHQAWKCLITFEDLADVVVPYTTDGKIRAARVILLHPISL